MYHLYTIHMACSYTHILFPLTTNDINHPDNIWTRIKFLLYSLILSLVIEKLMIFVAAEPVTFL